MGRQLVPLPRQLKTERLVRRGPLGDSCSEGPLPPAQLPCSVNGTSRQFRGGERGGTGQTAGAPECNHGSSRSLTEITGTSALSAQLPGFSFLCKTHLLTLITTYVLIPCVSPFWNVNSREGRKFSLFCSLLYPQCQAHN